MLQNTFLFWGQIIPAEHCLHPTWSVQQVLFCLSQRHAPYHLTAAGSQQISRLLRHLPLNIHNTAASSPQLFKLSPWMSSPYLLYCFPTWILPSGIPYKTSLQKHIMTTIGHDILRGADELDKACEKTWKRSCFNTAYWSTFSKTSNASPMCLLIFQSKDSSCDMLQKPPMIYIHALGLNIFFFPYPACHIAAQSMTEPQEDPTLVLQLTPDNDFMATVSLLAV